MSGENRDITGAVPPIIHPDVKTPLNRVSKVDKQAVQDPSGIDETYLEITPGKKASRAKEDRPTFEPRIGDVLYRSENPDLIAE